MNLLFKKNKIIKNINLLVLLGPFFVFNPVSYLFSQEKALIRILNADEISYERRIDPDIQMLVGNVALEHDSIFLFCDSALLNDRTNQVEAFNNIHIKSTDTLNLYGSYLIYDGNDKVAEIHDSVRLIDNQTTLYTNHLLYYRHSGIANYINGGNIINKDNELSSKKGYYYTNQNEFYFNGDVVLLNPEYNIATDTMMYNTETEITYFLSPTFITSKDDTIYCEYGWYDTKTDISEYCKNAWIRTGEQTVKGDTIYYDQTREYGRITGNIEMIDTVQNLILNGHFAIYDKANRYSMITDSARAVLIDNKDSLYLHADTLWTKFDSAQNAESLSAYYKTKFFRNDIQGMCDSLFYNFTDSLIILYKEPVLWSKDSQLTADSIHIYIKNEQIQRMVLHNTSLIISMDDTTRYNQIRGINMTGYFVDNELSKIIVEANSETIYFVREDDGALIGINKVKSGNMKIELVDNEIERITYIDQPSATLFPEDQIGQEDLYVRGFVWMGDRRPMDKNDIFRW